MAPENEPAVVTKASEADSDKVLWARKVRMTSELGILLALISFPLAAKLAEFVRDEKGAPSPGIFIIALMLINGAACVMAMWARREREALPVLQAWIPGCGCVVVGFIVFLTALLVGFAILFFPFMGAMAEQ